MLGYVNDPIAYKILPPAVKIHEILSFPRHWLQGYVYDPTGTFGWLVARTNIIDSFVLKGLEEAPSSPSYVILGAGFDTRAYRLPLDGVPVFEVDTAPTQETKKEVLKAVGEDISAVTYVPVDFNTEDFLERLEAHNFDVKSPVVITWEGVMPYLTHEAVNATLGKIFKTCASGSILIATFVNTAPESEEEIAKIYGGRRILDKIASLGEPSTFAITKGREEEYMKSFGYEVLSHLDADSMEQKYFRNFNNPTRVGGLFNIVAIRIP
eukprot:CAMPEP_0167763324 /NCGR_PEP_ID=MMETSP0110_2-20121227/13296_1 /TAXON_ID=629695 /ORGANISM="Gymnochlora sp., Strain CCMP2014" /LENGTH=266 /DNA_ID=CAMNT_0007650369 /DNA_START=104 /DNA_END=904 /DNA_ORIENTATION=+